jgi:uncharacterized membrane protein YidH (DUF202 family)
MFDLNSFKRKSPQQRFLFILGLVMFVFYMVMGLTLIIWKDMPLPIERLYRILLGCLLLVYAAFRFMRVIKEEEE